MLKKVLIIIGIVLAAAAAGFIGLVVYAYFHPEFGLKEPGAAEQSKTTAKPPSEALPSKSPAPTKPRVPKITKVNFPEKINFNEKLETIVKFEDSLSGVIKIEIASLIRSSTKLINFTAPNNTLVITMSTNLKVPIVDIQRLTLIDSAGNRSAPYIQQYQVADPTEYYERYDKERANQRPISRRLKLHFFVLSGTKSELEQGASFSSDDDALGAVSPAVAKLFEYTAVPEINGLWDQCSIAFELGNAKIVRAEKVKLPSGRFLSELFGDYKGERAALVPHFGGGGIYLIKDALPILGVPRGNLAVFITGYRLWVTDEGKSVAGQSLPRGDASIASWRHIHFIDENTGSVVNPKTILGSMAHEIGHNFGLYHPGMDKVVSEDKFSNFNLLNIETGLRSELIPEQCEVVNANLDKR